MSSPPGFLNARPLFGSGPILGQPNNNPRPNQSQSVLIENGFVFTGGDAYGKEEDNVIFARPFEGERPFPEILPPRSACFPNNH